MINTAKSSTNEFKKTWCKPVVKYMNFALLDDYYYKNYIGLEVMRIFSKLHPGRRRYPRK